VRLLIACPRRGWLVGLFGVLASGGLLGGCAHEYQAVQLDLKASGSDRIAVSVLDQRPYIYPGPKGKPPTFVGVQRGLDGMPFDVHTSSGRPVAEDWTVSVSNALLARGFKPEPVIVTNDFTRLAVMKKLADTGAPRAIFIGFTEWKVDALFDGSLKGDVLLQVLDPAGNVLAESRALGLNNLGGSLAGAEHARDATLAAYKATLEKLLNDPKVLEALK
jgi:hypothetical protein